MSDLVLVTGASGTLGRRIASALEQRGWRVRALVHRRPIVAAHETATGSILDEDAMRLAIRGCAAVVHLAAVTHARRASIYRRINVDGTRSIIAAAELEGVGRLLFVSSRAAAPLAGAYGVSKLQAEELVTASTLDWTIIRLPELYGVGGSEGVERLITLARKGRALLLIGDGGDEVCPMHIDDALAACVNGLGSEAAVRHTYTLGGECMTLRELAESARSIAGTSSSIVEIPRWLVRVAGQLGRVLPLPIYPDQLARLTAAKPPRSTEAATDLDFSARSLETGLRQLN